jgi:uncharacterized protein
MNHQILIDTSFLVALWNKRDKFYPDAIAFAATLDITTTIPAPVLVEMFYLLKERVNYRAAIQAYERTQSDVFRIESLTDADMVRMSDIMHKYADNQWDFADMAIMAMSERLNVTKICTFDQLDYGRFRPKHTPYFEILP